MGIIKKGVGCAVVLLGGFFLVGGCVTVMVAMSSQDKSGTSTPTSGQTPPPADDHATMPGNGTYQMGGIDGKDWGSLRGDRKRQLPVVNPLCGPLSSGTDPG